MWAEAIKQKVGRLDAYEKLRGAAFFLIYRVIVGDFREQARSYTGVA